jgi:hypothetical protein
MSKPEYVYVDAVKLGIDAATARRPRLQVSAIQEFGDILSASVSRHDWVQVPGEGVIHSTGQTIFDFLEEQLKTRPHWLVPKPVTDGADECWIDTSLAKQGARHQHYKQVLGSDKAAEKAMAEEAAAYGCVPGSLKQGTKPNSEKKAGATSDHSKNPFHKSAWNISKQGQLISALGFDKASAIAKSVGVKIGDTKPNANY